MSRPQKSGGNTLFAERERETKTREALIDQKAYERVKNERVGFTKVGNRFGRAVTRYIAFGDGNLVYYKLPEGGKRIGCYYFSPGTRCKILDIEDEDLSEDILESGMQCIRINGLRKKNGKERGPLFILFDTKLEAQTWERAFRHSKVEGTKREETEDIKFEEELDDDMDEEEQDRAGVETLVDSGAKDNKLNTTKGGIKRGMTKKDNNEVGKTRNFGINKMKFSFKDIGKKPDISQTNLNDNKYLEDEDIADLPIEDEISDEGSPASNDAGVVIGEIGDGLIDHEAVLPEPIDKDSVLRNQRVVLQTSKYLQKKKSWLSKQILTFILWDDYFLKIRPSGLLQNNLIWWTFSNDEIINP